MLLNGGDRYGEINNEKWLLNLNFDICLMEDKKVKIR